MVDVSLQNLAFLHLGGFPHQRKFAKVLVKSLIQKTLGFGRDSSISVLLDMRKDLIVATLPNGIRFLEIQIRISF